MCPGLLMNMLQTEDTHAAPVHAEPSPSSSNLESKNTIHLDSEIY